MSRLAAARERLENAVYRLEEAVDDAVEGGVLTDGGDLGAELAAVKADYAKLAAAAGQVDARLDRTIYQLEIVLEQ